LPVAPMPPGLTFARSRSAQHKNLPLAPYRNLWPDFKGANWVVGRDFEAEKAALVAGTRRCAVRSAKRLQAADVRLPGGGNWAAIVAGTLRRAVAGFSGRRTLSPTLSTREREPELENGNPRVVTGVTMAGTGGRSGSSNRRSATQRITVLLPLPCGEGWGEGKRQNPDHMSDNHLTRPT
jgi:hypothetical protein